MKKESDKITWFHNARLGMFVHWGLYSVLGRGEWVMYRERIPNDAYERLADSFRPTSFNPDEWCRQAQSAGMKYMVMTTCHHDGFSLFDSRHDAFNSVNTAARVDFVAEYVAACRRHGLGVGLYYSLGDWRYGIMKESDSAEKAAQMRELTHRQIEELMSNYGKIDILWYDGGWCYPSTMNDTSDDVGKFWQAEKLNASVRNLQPDILINDRSGTPEDIATPEGHVPSGGQGCWESCLTMACDENSGWGYRKHSTYKKTPAQIIYLLVQAVSRGGNTLFNVSPDANGTIPPWQQEILEAIGTWMADNAEAVYGVDATDASRDVNGIEGNSCGIFSEKGNILYFYVLEWPGVETVIPVMKRKITQAVLLKTGQNLSVNTDAAGRLILSGLPATPVDPYCSVIRLDTAAENLQDL
jgi:alpha-L-fucosidase